MRQVKWRKTYPCKGCDGWYEVINIVIIKSDHSLRYQSYHRIECLSIYYKEIILNLSKHYINHIEMS